MHTRNSFSVKKKNIRKIIINRRGVTDLNIFFLLFFILNPLSRSFGLFAAFSLYTITSSYVLETSRYVCAACKNIKNSLNIYELSDSSTCPYERNAREKKKQN